MPNFFAFGFSLLIALPAWSQNDTTPAQPPVPAMVGLDNSSTVPDTYNSENNGDRMMTPPPVSGQAYPVELTSEERSNYLRGGVAFTTAYTDNVLGGLTPQPVSDISYSVAPMLALDETTSRMVALSSMK